MEQEEKRTLVDKGRTTSTPLQTQHYMIMFVLCSLPGIYHQWKRPPGAQRQQQDPVKNPNLDIHMTSKATQNKTC